LPNLRAICQRPCAKKAFYLICEKKSVKNVGGVNPIEQCCPTTHVTNGRFIVGKIGVCFIIQAAIVIRDDGI